MSAQNPDPLDPPKPFPKAHPLTFYLTEEMVGLSGFLKEVLSGVSAADLLDTAKAIEESNISHLPPPPTGVIPKTPKPKTLTSWDPVSGLPRAELESRWEIPIYGHLQAKFGSHQHCLRAPDWMQLLDPVYILEGLRLMQANLTEERMRFKDRAEFEAVQLRLEELIRMYSNFGPAG